LLALQNSVTSNATVHTFLKFGARMLQSNTQDIYTFPFHKVIYNEKFLSPLKRKFCHIRLCSELALDKCKRLRAVFVDVLLVSIGVVAGAAVWVRGVAVRLDDGGASWRT
jgi:hypothetical protein